jgi:hypothetical protein
MAAHQVVADVGTFDVGIVDVIFKVCRDGELFGRLKVSQVAVEWQEAHVKKYVQSMEWGSLRASSLTWRNNSAGGRRCRA